jgi:hypothetical protein
MAHFESKFDVWQSVRFTEAGIEHYKCPECKGVEYKIRRIVICREGGKGAPAYCKYILKPSHGMALPPEIPIVESELEAAPELT